MAHYFLLALLALFNSCKTKNKPADSVKDIFEQPTTVTDSGKVIDLEANATKTLGKNIQCIFQDKEGNYWFGTQSQGVYRYDPSVSFKKGGKPLIQLTEKDGLSNNQIQTIQEDKAGNICFGTGGFGVSRFDGQSIMTLTDGEDVLSGRFHRNEWKIIPDELWFNAGAGVFRSNGDTLTYFLLPLEDFGSSGPQYPSDRLSPYAAYCTLKDKNGRLWCGTQSMGVCQITPSQESGTDINWFSEEGLAGPAVLAIFEDKNGILWFGNNGSGLFRFDPTTNVMTSFTKEKGLANDEFQKTGKSGPGTLARIYSINEDNSGNLWIGTVDAGVWRYDGKHLKNYTTKDGLSSNAVITIYKDKKGELWFGTETDVCKFNGTTFLTFAID